MTTTLALCALAWAPLVVAADRPNIVFVLIDDMSWSGTQVRMDADLPASATAFIQTPNLVRLAQQGMVFRNARASASMCAPSRCAIQTGMMPARNLFSGNGGFGTKTDGTVKYLTRGQDAAMPLLQPESQGNIRFPSIGEVLRTSGYATAHFGKWHIYGGGPAQHGYDESDGDTDNKGFSPIDPATGEKTATSDDPKRVFSITERGLAFMERQVRASKPFFVQLSHYATHAAYQATRATLARYEALPVFQQITSRKDRERAMLFAAMTEDLDTSIGRVLGKLDELGIAGSTYVVVTSDNGYHSWNEGHEPLRGGKWWLWENGLRVPMIIRGPGVAAGSRNAVNVVGCDLMPTFADLAGASERVPKEVDGVSLRPLLSGGQVPDSLAQRPLYFHYPHYRVSPPCSGLIVGDRKLLHFYEWPEGRFLYDLASDLGEKTNLAKAQQDQAERMQRLMMEHLRSVGAYFPKPNPNADPNVRRYDPDDLADAYDDKPPKGQAGGKRSPKDEADE